jgi:hypothetical protein
MFSHPTFPPHRNNADRSIRQSLVRQSDLDFRPTSSGRGRSSARPPSDLLAPRSGLRPVVRTILINAARLGLAAMLTCGFVVAINLYGHDAMGDSLTQLACVGCFVGSAVIIGIGQPS